MGRAVKGMEQGARVAVSAHTSTPGQGLTYPAFTGALLEYCNGEGWDVVDVRTEGGEVQSVYSFDVSRRMVYTGAAGYQNCDAAVSVAGNTAAEVEEALDAFCRNEVDDEGTEDDLWTVGPFAETLDSLQLSERQLGELNGGWQVSFYNSPDAPEVKSGKLVNAVGYSDVLPTELEAQRMAQEARDSGAWVEVKIQKVAPSVTYLEVA